MRRIVRAVSDVAVKGAARCRGTARNRAGSRRRRPDRGRARRAISGVLEQHRRPASHGLPLRANWRLPRHRARLHHPRFAGDTDRHERNVRGARGLPAQPGSAPGHFRRVKENSQFTVTDFQGTLLVQGSAFGPVALATFPGQPTDARLSVHFGPEPNKPVLTFTERKRALSLGRVPVRSVQIVGGEIVFVR